MTKLILVKCRCFLLFFVVVFFWMALQRLNWRRYSSALCSESSYLQKGIVGNHGGCNIMIDDLLQSSGS